MKIQIGPFFHRIPIKLNSGNKKLP